ncbi:MAG: hypothetical protein AABY79_10565, partial [Nitrospirota bacterium]
ILCHARRFLSGIHVFVNIGFLPKTRRNDNRIRCLLTYELISTCHKIISERCIFSKILVKRRWFKKHKQR